MQNVKSKKIYNTEKGKVKEKIKIKKTNNKMKIKKTIVNKIKKIG